MSLSARMYCCHTSKFSLTHLQHLQYSEFCKKLAAETTCKSNKKNTNHAVLNHLIKLKAAAATATLCMKKKKGESMNYTQNWNLHELIIKLKCKLRYIIVMLTSLHPSTFHFNRWKTFCSFFWWFFLHLTRIFLRIVLTAQNTIVQHTWSCPFRMWPLFALLLRLVRACVRVSVSARFITQHHHEV